VIAFLRELDERQAEEFIAAVTLLLTHLSA
jgi:hypothetical protein